MNHDDIHSAWLFLITGSEHLSEGANVHRHQDACRSLLLANIMHTEAAIMLNSNHILAIAVPWSTINQQAVVSLCFILNQSAYLYLGTNQGGSDTKSTWTSPEGVTNKFLGSYEMSTTRPEGDFIYMRETYISFTKGDLSPRIIDEASHQ